MQPPDSASPPRLSKRIKTAASITAVGSVLTMGLSTLCGIAVARSGGPAAYAVFVAANMILFVCGVLCQCGLVIPLSKHIAVAEESGHFGEVRHWCATVLLVLVLVALFVGAVTAWQMPRLENYLHVAMGPGYALLFPLLLALTVASYCSNGIYGGLLRPQRIMATTTAGPLAMLFYILARYVQLKQGAGGVLPIWGAVATSYGVSGLVALVQLRSDNLLGRPLPLGALRKLVKDVPLALSFDFFMVFSNWSDRWIIGAQLGAQSMGLYSAAAAIIQAALRIPTNIASLLVPASSKVAQAGIEKSARFNAALVRAFGLFAMLMLVIILLAGADILRLLFGPGFLPAAPALALMTPCLIAAGITMPFLSAFTGAAAESDTTRNRTIMLLLAATLAPRLLLLYFGTRSGGLHGTAAATALADLLLACCCVVAARRSGLVFPLRALGLPLALGVVSGSVGWMLLRVGMPSPLAAVIAAALFVPVAYRLRRHGAPSLAAAPEGMVK